MQFVKFWKVEEHIQCRVEETDTYRNICDISYGKNIASAPNSQILIDS